MIGWWLLPALAAEPKSLFEAARDGDLARVEQLLAAGADLSEGDPPTMLMVAAMGGDPRIVAVMLDAGASIGARDANGEDALAWAVRHRRPEAVEVLLARGADPNGGGHLGRTPLMLALESVQSGDLAVVRALLAAGARVDRSDENGQSTLASAARYGHDPGALRLVLERAGPEVLRAWQAEPAVAWTALAGETENVRILLANGFPADLRDADGERPLELAARQGHADVVALLLGAGAPVTVEAFDAACRRGHLPVARLLLPGIPVARLDAALVSAARLGDPAVVEALLDRGASAADGEALVIAASDGRAALVDRLLRAGADLGLAGPAALVGASAAGHDGVVADLLARGVPVDAADGGGRTALAHAATNGRVPVVERLLAAGARDLPDREGRGTLEQVAAGREQALAWILASTKTRDVHPGQAAAQAELARLEPAWARIEVLLRAPDRAPDRGSGR